MLKQFYLIYIYFKPILYVINKWLEKKWKTYFIV